MKKKSKHTIPRKTKQFRYHKVEISKGDEITVIWHPAYIFLIIGNLYRYVTITHSDSVDGEEVVVLEFNPNKNDKRPSYRVVGYREDTKDRFGQKHKRAISDKDDEAIRKDKKR